MTPYLATISFDLDGVLQRSCWRSSQSDGVFGHIRRELAPHVPDLSGEEAEHEALRLILAEHHARLYSDRMVPAFDWDSIVRTVADRLGYPGRIDCGALVSHYVEVPGLVTSYPGARESLSTLAERGHTLVSVTNGFRAYQEPVQRKLGLYHFYRQMLTPDETGAAKPEPGIYKAAEKYGPAPFIHVGDVLPHDVAGAKGAGWLAIYVVQPGAPGYTEMPGELAALPPHQRTQAGMAWLQERIVLDRRWHGHPPVELQDALPDAVVRSLAEVPEAVDALLGLA